ncbi:MAG: SAM-dependent methyltransferase [Gammaproteobacteria bacterium]|nr:SAM-dependent methyltransferase [Gammaproteobacteria bacterium]
MNRVLRPTIVPFVSFPYEWSFSQLKVAALLTLSIMRRSLEREMVLKDASAYNVQFLGSRPIFVDTLSFERYVVGEPWVAYRQFCQHFLAPLVLMSRVDLRLGQLAQTNIDGIPLDLATALLPGRSKLRPGIATHLVLHANVQKRFAKSTRSKTASHRAKVSRVGLQAIVNSLESTIKGLRVGNVETEWKDYAAEDSYSAAAAAAKRRLVGEFLANIGRSDLVLDLGANKGDFSVLASKHADYVVAVDMDPAVLDILHAQLAATDNRQILPLRVDLAVPSPAIGWDNTERPAFKERTPDATVLALAVLHHMAIGNNVPMRHIAKFLSGFARNLIVEFVPKSDPQVQRLLGAREDVFPRYSRECFEADFGAYYGIRRRQLIDASDRTLYLMERRHA